MNYATKLIGALCFLYCLMVFSLVSTPAMALPGICGVMNGQFLTNPPATQLCVNHDIGPSAVSGAGPWYWQCNGTDGGVATKCSAGIQPLQATRAYSFLNTLGADGGAVTQAGANVLISYFHYTGLVHDRMSAGSGGTPLPPKLYASFCRAGISIDLLANYSAWASAGPQAVANVSLKYLKAINAIAPGCVDMIEGINEPDINSLFGSSLEQRESVGDAISVAIWKTIKPHYPKIPIMVWAGGGDYDYSTGTFSRTNLTPYGDYCNLHDYYGSARNSGNTWLGGDNPGSLASWRACQGVVTGKQVVTTETGWNTNTKLTTSTTVNADTQAKMDINKIMDHAELRMPRTYVFCLYPTDYGLFDKNGNPRESAIVLHNLTTLLKDSGTTAQTFQPATFPYMISGLSELSSDGLSTGHSYLIQKSDGSLWIMIWNEADTWNFSQSSENIIPPVAVTLKLPAAYSGLIYDPFGCSATQSICKPSTGNEAIATFSQVTHVPITLTDHMIIVELTPKFN